MRIIARIADALRAMDSLDAVVLGGSRASGHAGSQSDIDIGVYYGATHPLDLVKLNAIVQECDDAQRANLVTAPGGWGPWVNAGAWMTVDGQHVDIILRETTRVAQVIAACEVGQISANYQPGHPHAYINLMYMGELAVSHLLWDATGTITLLKQRALQYPEAARQAIMDQFGFEARFSADIATNSVVRNDAYYVMAHIVRSISAMNQVLFACNRQYCLNEKQAVARVQSLSCVPPKYQARIDNIVALAGYDQARACTAVHELVDEVQAIVRLTM